MASYPPLGKIFRVALAVAAVVAWLLISWLRPEWLRWFTYLFQDVPRMYQMQIGTASAVAMVLYLSSWLWTLYGPRRSRRADDAQGLGCVMFACWIVGGMLLLLTIGMIFQWTFLIIPIAYLTLLPLVFVLPAFFWEKMKDPRKKRAAER